MYSINIMAVNGVTSVMAQYEYNEMWQWRMSWRIHLAILVINVYAMWYGSLQWLACVI